MEEERLSRVVYERPHQRVAQIDPTWTILDNSDEFLSVASPSTIYNIHRGTTTSEDLRTDVALAFGQLQHTDRYKRARQKSMNTRNEGKHVVEVGHSLGGSLAEDIAVELGHESIVFNKGTTPFHSRAKDPRRHIHIRNEGDLISQFDPDAVTRPSLKRKRDMLDTFGMFTGHPLFAGVSRLRNWYHHHK